jgi:ABC-type microcin C transport system permease subunit YejB
MVILIYVQDSLGVSIYLIILSGNGEYFKFFSLHGEKINHHMERVPGDIRFTKSDDSPNKILWDNR